MKQFSFHKYLLAALAGFLLSTTMVKAQVKIGNNAQNVNPDAIFELESSNRGMLFPRIALQSTTSSLPLSSFVNGMMVYNTATATDVTPGMYYCDGTKWLKIVAGAFSGAPTANWGVNGNNSTNPTINFLGTTDSVAIRFRTNNIERMQISANGNIGIGTNNPGAKLEINGQLKIDSLTAGNLATDQLLVANPADGRVKVVSAASLSVGTNVQKRTEVVTQMGQTIFTTPAPVTDINKISLYRNGVLITCAVYNSTSVVAEVPCMSGDEIRIIQLL